MSYGYSFKVLECNSLNTKSGYFYPKAVVLSALKEYKKFDPKLGQLMSSSYNDDRGEIDLRKVSHTVKKFYWKKDSLYMTIQPLETPEGQKLRDLILRDMNKLDVTFIGEGETEVQHGHTVVTSLKFLRFDIGPKLSNLSCSNSK
jgi:hypothetical protein